MVRKIKLNRAIEVGDKKYEEGDIIKLGEDECKDWVDNGYAEWVRKEEDKDDDDGPKQVPSSEKQDSDFAKDLADDIKRRGKFTEEGIVLEGLTTKKKLKWKETKSEEQKEREQLRSQFIDITTGKNKDWNKGTEILAKYLNNEYEIYTTKNDKKSETWIYKDGVYRPEGKSELKKILRRILRDRYNIWVFNKVLNKIEADTFIDEEDFFKQHHPKRVPVKNGILNIESKELEPFDPRKIFFNKLNARYDPEAECPKIEEFLEDVLRSKDDKKVFYEMLGFCLLKEYKFEKAFIMLGEGRNGKDKTLELIKRLLSPENCASVDLHRLEEDEWATYELFGKMANLAGEISGRDLKNATTFKACTGRSLIAGKRKFMSTINFVNYAKFIFACNKLPRVYENTRAFWDRWIPLKFPYTFVKEKEYEEREDEDHIKLRDPNIIEEIVNEEELSGLLNKALEGLNRLTKNKTFTKAPGVEEVKEFWIRKSDSFMAFCMDKIEEEPDEYITKEELRRKYKHYCKNHNVKSRSDRAIKATLQEEFGVIDEYKTIHRNSSNIDGTRKSCWVGIKWKDKGNDD